MTGITTISGTRSFISPPFCPASLRIYLCSFVHHSATPWITLLGRSEDADSRSMREEVKLHLNQETKNKSVGHAVLRCHWKLGRHWLRFSKQGFRPVMRAGSWKKDARMEAFCRSIRSQRPYQGFVWLDGCVLSCDLFWYWHFLFSGRCWRASGWDLPLRKQGRSHGERGADESCRH